MVIEPKFQVGQAVRHKMAAHGNMMVTGILFGGDGIRLEYSCRNGIGEVRFYAEFELAEYMGAEHGG